MLGQNANGEFAIGEIEALVPGSVMAVAAFQAAQAARVRVGAAPASLAAVGVQTAAGVTVTQQLAAIVTVEII